MHTLFLALLLIADSVFEGVQAADFSAQPVSDSPAAGMSATPVNDNFAQRRRIFGEYVRVPGTTVGATTEPEEPNAFTGSVWFSWIAPHKGTYEFSVSPHGYLEVFTGGSLNALAWVPGVSSPRSTLRLNGGERYQIRVSASDFAGLVFELKIRPVVRPRNDDFEKAIPFAGTNSIVRGTVYHSTDDSGGPFHIGGTGNVWYRWQAPDDGLFLASTVNENSSITVAVYQGPTATALQPVGQQVSGIRSGSAFYAESGGIYWISVSGYNATPSAFELSVSAETPPSNDLFQNGIVVSGAEVSVEGGSLGARYDPFEPYTFVFSQEYIWYSWTAPTSGLYRIATPLITVPATNGGGGIPRPPFYFNSLVVSTGNASTSQVEVARGEAENGALVRADAGVTYHVAVPGRMSSFQFKITPLAPEPNDDYANATLLDGVFAAGGSTLNATPEPDHPYSDRHVWYRWSAPSNGSYAITVMWNQSLSIYQGTEFATAEFVSGGPRPILRAAAGEEFHLGVAPTYLANGGSFILRIDAVTPPANDDFVNREILSGTNIAFVAQMRNASVEPDEPGSHTVWFSWTAPMDGFFALRCTTNFGNVTIFTGSGFGNDAIASGNPEVFFEAREGMIFHFQIDQYDPVSDVALELRKVPAPPNDDFANRIVLTGTSVSTTGTLAGATLEPGESTGQSDRSVWWSWTAPHAGRASIDFNPAGYLFTSVYTGETIDSLEVVTAGYWLEFSAAAGVTYQFAVKGSDIPFNDSFPLNIMMLDTPSNDAFADRKRLIRRGRGTTHGASREAGEPFYETDPNGASVWWKWRAPRNGVYDLKLITGSVLATIYTGARLEELEPAGNATQSQQIRLRATAGTTYVIEISSPNRSGGEYEFELVRRNAPPNDDFARRILLAGTNITVIGKNEFATIEPDELEYAYYYRPERTVWWKWIAPINGTAFIRFDEGTHKLVSAYHGNWPELEVLAGDEFGIHFDVRAGVEYQIAVDSVTYGDSPDPWQFELLLVPPPANDNFASRVPLSGADVQVRGTVVGATSEEGEPASSFQHSVWWSWTAPETGRYTLRASSTNQWPTMMLFTGDSVSNLEFVATANFSYQHAEVNLPFVAGEEISIRIDNPIETAGDSIDLHIYKVEPPANDDFVNRSELIDGRGTNTNEGAASEPGEPLPNFDPRFGSLWWRFSANSSGWHSVAATLRLAGGVQQYPQTILFTGNNLTSLVPVSVSYEHPEPRWTLTAGTEYAIQVGDPEHRLGVVEIEVEYLRPPFNDSFSNAIPMFGDHAVAFGSNSWATLEAGEPASHWGVANSVWWRWIAPSNGAYLLVADQSIGARYQDIFTGGSISNLTLLRGTIYATYGGNLFRAAGGVEHFIRVGSGRYQEGAIALQLDRVETPPNDDFANRTLLSGSHISILASNYNATAEPGDPAAGSLGEQTIWWRWTSSASGTATIAFSQMLYGGVFQGNALSNLVPIGSVGFISERMFPVEAGVEYSIGVTTWSYYASEFTLTLDAPVPSRADKRGVQLPWSSAGARASVIETSTNLVDWMPFRTNDVGEGIFSITPSLDEPQRFFRVR